MNDRPTHTLRTDHPVRYEIEQIEMIPWAGESERLVPGRTSWSIEPIEFDTPEQARALVGEHIVLDVEGDRLFHGIGEYADGAELSVRITGPVAEPPAVTQPSDGVPMAEQRLTSDDLYAQIETLKNSLVEVREMLLPIAKGQPVILNVLGVIDTALRADL